MKLIIKTDLPYDRLKQLFSRHDRRQVHFVPYVISDALHYDVTFFLAAQHVRVLQPRNEAAPRVLARVFQYLEKLVLGRAQVHCFKVNKENTENDIKVIKKKPELKLNRMKKVKRLLKSTK